MMRKELRCKRKYFQVESMEKEGTIYKAEVFCSEHNFSTNLIQKAEKQNGYLIHTETVEKELNNLQSSSQLGSSYIESNLFQQNEQLLQLEVQSFISSQKYDMDNTWDYVQNSVYFY